jgi:hypothetical protein
VAKDKKKKKDKKAKRTASARGSTFKALAQNPLVADVVAAALVATASALKDSKRARRLATEAADELGRLSKAGAEQGNALWAMALQIGRRSLEALTAEDEPKPAKAKPSSKSAGKKRPTRSADRDSIKDTLKIRAAGGDKGRA